jgi:hypothetical protein
MDSTEIMNAIQSKLDAHSTEIRTLLQTAIDSHSGTIHSTLHNHLLEVDAKVAKFRPATQHQTSGPNSNASRAMKLSVPRFDGSNPIDWLFQIESFFNFHEMPEASRLQIVAFHFRRTCSSVVPMGYA